MLGRALTSCADARSLTASYLVHVFHADRSHREERSPSTLSHILSFYTCHIFSEGSCFLLAVGTFHDPSSMFHDPGSREAQFDYAPFRATFLFQL